MAWANHTLGDRHIPQAGEGRGACETMPIQLVCYLTKAENKRQSRVTYLQPTYSITVICELVSSVQLVCNIRWAERQTELPSSYN